MAGCENLSLVLVFCSSLVKFIKMRWCLICGKGGFFVLQAVSQTPACVLRANWDQAQRTTVCHLEEQRGV